MNLSGRPVPTERALIVAALALAPAVLAVVVPAFGWFVLAADVAVLLLLALDFALAPPPSSVRVRRVIEPVLSSGAMNRVRVELERAPGVTQALEGEVRDTVAPGPRTEGTRQPLRLEERATVDWKLCPLTRGDLTLGDVYLRLRGPLGLCSRQFAVPAGATVKVYPDLTALTLDALKLARANEDEPRRTVRVRSEGREFESLREYRLGDDRRLIDWKASARRARPIVRVHQPERNQTVLLLLDAGRHMAGESRGRRKLDDAVDAALRLAKVSLDQGDLVGVMAFGASVKSWLPPRKGKEQLSAITHALYRVEATLEESDYGAALDLAFARGVRRSLVVLLTDLTDAEAAATLVKRTARLVPRHLPLVASLLDEDLRQAAGLDPTTATAAYERVVASRLQGDLRRTVAQLRDAGAHVVQAPSARFGAATVNSYLEIKAGGLL